MAADETFGTEDLKSILRLDTEAAFQAALLDRIGVYERDNAKHAVWIGGAIVHAAEKGWIPRGEAAMKKYCRDHFGLSASRVRQCRSLFAQQPNIEKASELVNNSEQLQGIEIPHRGTIERLIKELGAFRVYKDAIGAGHDEEQALCRAESVLAGKARSNTPALNPMRDRVTMLSVITAICLHLCPELRDTQLPGDRQAFRWSSTAEIIAWATDADREQLIALDKDQGTTELSELDLSCFDLKRDVVAAPQRNERRGRYFRSHNEYQKASDDSDEQTSSQSASTADVKADLLACIQRGMTNARDISKSLGLPRKTVSRELWRLSRAGMVKSSGHATYTVL